MWIFSHLRVEKKCNFGLTCIRFKLSYRYLAKDKRNFHACYFFVFSVNLQCNHRCKCLFWHRFICGCISIIFAFVCHYWLHAFECSQPNAKHCCCCCCCCSCCWFVSNIQSVYIQNAKISKSKIETQTKCWSKSRWAALNLKAVFYNFHTFSNVDVRNVWFFFSSHCVCFWYLMLSRWNVYYAHIFDVFGQLRGV